ncbi:MAG: hydrogenase expression/formation protein HypE [Gammaproteobacteria bacterium HGW-Gammaproteobacteria-4]|jgi:hydrogenase expression/formation protein HypE|nr:MAG: hydrogenase expression/formation protein HypE [Gammaproteobacteria bacterium HGW-Gammaproteobacteria-4]PKP68357.1 MAG: hydrogenase expression/formation protein HypE [Alphaproteobacteria bacterium HGW-Alphaproteobacteria-5]
MRDSIASGGVIQMSHGAGGRDMTELIERMFVTAFANPHLSGREDQAVLDLPAGRLAMSTDSYVVSPLFFPGGDIGSLAVNGTINDVAMAGAWPMAISLGLIIEEGFALSELARVIDSMAQAARAAGVPIVTGDTKVVENGKGDGLFVNTTGIGQVREGVHISATSVRPGDVVLVSGYLGDHGVAVMAERGGFDFETTIRSDCAALHGLVAALLDAVPETRMLRDPTRGGLAAVLNEIALASGIGFRIRESDLPIRAEVAGACELLGLDPLYVANEGKLVAMVPPQSASAALAALRDHPLGRDVAIIGVARADPHHFVEMETRFGGVRMVDWIAGEQLPRIC